MLSTTRCSRCQGFLRLQSDPYGTFFTCIGCGADFDATCPHCKTQSILLRPAGSGLSISCKSCGCANNMLAAENCAKSRQDLVPA